MTTKLIPKEPKHLDCCVCLEELPDTVVNSQEVDQYVQHYCGIECYARWKQEIVKITDTAELLET